MNQRYYSSSLKNPRLANAAGCRYGAQFKNEYKHTFTVTLTRRHIGPQGFCLGSSPHYSMCTDKSCALVRATNLDAGYVVAHQLGHALGIGHDEEAGCRRRRRSSGGNIMSRKFFTTNSYYQWTRCNARMLRQNMKYFTCLREKPTTMMQDFHTTMQHLPGELFNRSEQCEIFHGNNSAPCSHELVEPCKHLLCLHEGRCKPSRWHARGATPLEGSGCGRTRWCIRGTCRKKLNTTAVDGGWSDWSEFSPSCNESSNTTSMLLLQTRTRNCTNPAPKRGGSECVGSSVTQRVVIRFEDTSCLPYTRGNLMSILGPSRRITQVTDRIRTTMSPCASYNAKNKTWKEFSRAQKTNYFHSYNFSCDFELDGTCSWYGSPGGNKEWNLRSGKTPTQGTGPTYDHTTNTSEGKYIYMELSHQKKLTLTNR